jgi:hypothetical protein
VWRYGNDNDSAFIQTTIDSIGPIFAQSNTIGRNPYREAARPQVASQPLREGGVLMGMTDEHLSRVAAQSDGGSRNARGLVELLSVCLRAGQRKVGDQVIQSRPALHRLDQFPRLAVAPLAAQVLELNTQVKAERLQLFEVEVRHEKLVQLGRVWLAHGIWSQNDSPADNQRQSGWE